MTVESPELQVKLHLVDGRDETFNVRDAAEAAHILDLINPGKFFEPKQLVIGCEHHITAFQTTLITHIEFVSPRVPAWNFHHNVRSIREVAPDVYFAKLAASGKFETPVGEVYQAFAEIELTSGINIYLTLDINTDAAISPLTSLDQHIFLQQLFHSYGMHVHHRNVGAIIINPGHIARLSMHPGPSRTPAGAWTGERAN